MNAHGRRPHVSLPHLPHLPHLPPVDEPGTDHIADPVVPSVSSWNIANALTMMRVVLVPVFAAVLLHGDGHETRWRIAACLVFVIASVTDLIDGDIARKRNLITEFGKLMDPIADKALMGAALVGLSMLGDIAWWVTATILVREVGVTLLRFWVITHGVIPASRGGKLKTMLQALSIGLLVLPLSGALHTAATAVLVAALVVTIVTGLDYVRRAVALRRKSNDAPPARSAAAS
jgi:CDP-diacylglycerol--glycerol-3-phosphate 3-phosphatidyltransferase